MAKGGKGGGRALLVSPYDWRVAGEYEGRLLMAAHNPKFGIFKRPPLRQAPWRKGGRRGNRWCPYVRGTWGLHHQGPSSYEGNNIPVQKFCQIFVFDSKNLSVFFTLLLHGGGWGPGNVGVPVARGN